MLKEISQASLSGVSKQHAVMQLQSSTGNGQVYLCPQCDQPLKRAKI